MKTIESILVIDIMIIYSLYVLDKDIENKDQNINLPNTFQLKNISNISHVSYKLFFFKIKENY